MRNRGLLLSGAALSLALACGGGGGSAPAPAKTLVYTNPTPSATDWQMVADAQASTPTHLVLDLVAPAGASGQGVTLTLATDSGKAAWTLVNGSPSSPFLQCAYATPLVEHAGVQGPVLRLVVAQAPGTPVVYGSSPVIQVALDLASGAVPGTVALTASQGGHLGAGTAPVAISVSTGVLQAE
jgi:hypothetical protein